MAGGAFAAGSVVSKMILDRTQWKKSTQDAEKEAKGLSGAIQKHGAGIRKVGMAMTAVGGAIVGSLALMVKQYVAAGDEVHKMAQRTGFSTETLSELRYAAEISGASIASLEKGVKKMSKTILDAGDGLTTYVRAFDRIGIAVKDLEGLNPEQQFMKIGLAIAAVEDPTTRAAAAVDIFGRAGTQLLPLFNQGVSGINELRQAAHELGIVFDQEAANKAARLADAQVTLRESMKGVSKSIAETFVPMLADMAEKAAKVISKITKWIQENPKLASTIVKIVAGVGALMLVLGPLAIVLPSLVAGVGLLAGAFVGIIAPIAAVTAAVGVAAVTFLKLKSAKDEARKAGERYEKNIERVKDKLKEVQIAVGMSAKEWEKLTKKYKGNYAALTMAIYKGKEGKEMQEALADVSKRSKEAYDKQKEATIKLGDSFKGVYEKQKTWIDYIKSIGIMTLEEKRAKIDELKGYLVDLKMAHENSLLSEEDYAAAVKKTTEELTQLEGVYKAVVPEGKAYYDIVTQIPGATESATYATRTMEQQLYDLASQWGVTATDVKLSGLNMMSTMMQLSGIGFPNFTLAAKESTTTVSNEWTQMADGIKTKWITNFSEVLKGSKSIGEGLKGIFTGVKDQFFDMVAKMVAQWTLKFVGSILKGGEGLLGGFKSLFGGITSLFKKTSEDMVSTFTQAGGQAGKGLTSQAGKAIKGFDWGGLLSGAIGGAISGVISGLITGAKMTNQIRILRDINWWIQAMYKLQESHILAELYKIKDERLGEMFPKFDSMLAELYQIRAATKGTLAALTSQGTAYVDVFRSAIFEGVGEKISDSVGVMGTNITSSIGEMEMGLGGAISSMGEDIGGAIHGMGDEMGGAIRGIDFPEFDYDRISDKFTKGIPEAQGGGMFTRPGPVMTHGTPANPEFIGTAKQLSRMGTTEAKTMNVYQTVNLNGQMITTREYTRNEIIPEMLDALDAKVRKTEFQEKLGIR